MRTLRAQTIGRLRLKELWVVDNLLYLIFFLKRSPTPKLGDLRPKVAGNVCVNSLGVGVVPEIDLNRWSRENENFCFVGEKFIASWVTSRHLCLPDVERLIVVGVVGGSKEKLAATRGVPFY